MAYQEKPDYHLKLYSYGTCGIVYKSAQNTPDKRQIQVIETIRAADWVEIFHINQALHEESWSLLKERQDKTWSLVDCSSIVVMKHRGITNAFTTDNHFEQAGLVRKLK